MNLNVSHFVQVPMSLITILINFYSLLAIAVVKQLRNLEFYLVAFQSSLDLIVSGLWSLIHFGHHLRYSYSHFCFYALGAGFQYEPYFFNRSDLFTYIPIELNQFCRFLGPVFLLEYTV